MDLVTAIAILVQNVGQYQVLASQLNNLAYQANDLINQENSVAEVNPQIHALTANMTINIQSLRDTVVIVQQAVDKVAELSNV